MAKCKSCLGPPLAYKNVRGRAELWLQSRQLWFAQNASFYPMRQADTRTCRVPSTQSWWMGQRQSKNCKSRCLHWEACESGFEHFSSWGGRIHYEAFNEYEYCGGALERSNRHAGFQLWCGVQVASIQWSEVVRVASREGQMFLSIWHVRWCLFYFEILNKCDEIDWWAWNFWVVGVQLMAVRLVLEQEHDWSFSVPVDCVPCYCSKWNKPTKTNHSSGTKWHLPEDSRWCCHNNM